MSKKEEKVKIICDKCGVEFIDFPTYIPMVGEVAKKTVCGKCNFEIALGGDEKERKKKIEKKAKKTEIEDFIWKLLVGIVVVGILYYIFFIADLTILSTL